MSDPASMPPSTKTTEPTRQHPPTQEATPTPPTLERASPTLNERAQDIENARDATEMDILKHMHDVAGKYHLHYSTVRTTATSLVLPIGLLASITLLTNCSDGIRVPMRFLIFIIIATFFLNTLFARWSRACRHLERYYEEEMERNFGFAMQKYGFRHLFRKKIRKIRPVRASNKDPISPLARLSPYNPKTWLDPFVWSILVLGIVFLWFYDQMFHYACGGISLGEKTWLWFISHV